MWGAEIRKKEKATDPYIKEITSKIGSSNTKSERTEVLYGAENTTNAILNFLSNVDTMY